MTEESGGGGGRPREAILAANRGDTSGIIGISGSEGSRDTAGGTAGVDTDWRSTAAVGLTDDTVTTISDGLMGAVTPAVRNMRLTTSIGSVLSGTPVVRCVGTVTAGGGGEGNTTLFDTGDGLITALGGFGGGGPLGLLGGGFIAPPVVVNGLFGPPTVILNTGASLGSTDGDMTAGEGGSDTAAG